MSRARNIPLVLALVAVAFGAGYSLRGQPARIDVSADAASKAASSASAGFGALQASAHKAGITTAHIVPFIRTLNVGDSGPTVRQMQRALIAAKARPARFKATGHFGKITEREVVKFQHRKRVKPATGIYGKRTHHQLSPYYDLAGRRALQAVAHTRQQLTIAGRFVHAASVAWLHRAHMAYSESGTRSLLPLLPLVPPATDCSGYATWLFRNAGLPDPNGFSYVVVGYTGTLARHGVRVSANGAFHVGDLVFYGGGFPYGHVAIVVDAFRRLVSSHGSPGIRVLPFNYRPVSAVRRYY